MPGARRDCGPAYLPSPGQLAPELPVFRPTVLLAVPRVLEKVIAAARAQAEAGGHQRLFAAAEATAIAYSRASRWRRGPWLRLRHARIRPAGLPQASRDARRPGRLDNQRRRAAGRGDRGHFLRGAGLTVLEGWGLTETTGGITLNPPARQQTGSVGPPLPGSRVRTAPDGEIEVQGPTVFQGYWQNQEATKEAFDGPWLRTGDLGRTGDDGFVYITGRKKELIVTAGGKNVAPGPIEDRVREHWLIAECVVIGDRRPYITALVTLDGDAFARWKRRSGKPPDATVADLRVDPALRAVVDRGR